MTKKEIIYNMILISIIAIIFTVIGAFAGYVKGYFSGLDDGANLAGQMIVQSLEADDIEED